MMDVAEGIRPVWLEARLTCAESLKWLAHGDEFRNGGGPGHRFPSLGWLRWNQGQFAEANLSASRPPRNGAAKI